MAKITIFGLAGTGTSSVGKELAKRLNYSFLSSGQVFRQKAESLGLDLYDFEALCSQKPEYDKALDQEIATFGKTNDNFVVESRLAWYFIPDSIKIKIICDDSERVKRVAGRDKISFEEAKTKTEFREGVGAKRYEEYYGLTNFGADENFDLILDSTHWPVEEIVNKIESLVKEKTSLT